MAVSSAPVAVLTVATLLKKLALFATALFVAS
jgi:hypothetical protein